jgi:hypothetical protein
MFPILLGNSVIIWQKKSPANSFEGLAIHNKESSRYSILSLTFITEKRRKIKYAYMNVINLSQALGTLSIL